MDTLKSYFTKMKLLPGQTGKSWKFTRKGSFGKSRQKNKYSRSKSQNDAAFDPSNDPDFHEEKVNAFSKNGTLLARDTSGRESGKQPPAKPPRRDHVFSVKIDANDMESLGVSVDNIGTNTCQVDLMSTIMTGGTNDLYDSNDDMMYRTLSPIKVVAIRGGSKADLDQRIQVNDEVIDINGRSVQGELVPCVRRMLSEAVKSGSVTLTLRRKRRRNTQTSSSPTYSPDTPRTSSHSNIIESCHHGNGLKNNSAALTQSASALDTSSYRGNGHCMLLNSLNNSETSLTASNDDVFTNSVSEVNLMPRSVQNVRTTQNGVKKYTPSPGQRRRNGLDLVRMDEQRTQSASAVEDIQWDPLQRQNSDYVNTAELAKQNNYGVLYPASNNSETELNVYQSDTELQMCSRMYRQRKMSSRSSDAFRQMNNSTPTSLCSFDEGSEYDFSCQSSPAVGKKRMITRLHLLKENDSLGLHIAGGRGSKRGDIGIFVAGVTESGPASRDGRLKRGDELLMINGRSLIGLTHTEAVELLRNAPKLVQLVIAAKVRKSSSMASTSSSLQTPLLSPSMADSAGTPSIPELMAQTPQGTIIKWEDMFDKFHKATSADDKPPSGPSAGQKKYTKRRSRSQSPRHLPPITITLVKGQGGKGLGFTIVGGNDTPISHMGIIVKRVFQNGLVAEDGRIKQGDEILELNGECISHLSHKDVISKFRQLKKGPVAITFRKRLASPQCSPARMAYTGMGVSCDGSPVSTPGQSPHSSTSDLHDLDLSDTISTSSMTSADHRPTFSVPINIPRKSSLHSMNASIEERLSPDNKPKTQHEIQLVKEGTSGLGISVIRKTYDGASEILIQDISHGSPAHKDGRLRKGDLIMEVNGRRMTNMTLLDAYQLFRNLQPGPVDILIRRSDNQQKIRLLLPEATTGTDNSDDCCSEDEQDYLPYLSEARGVHYNSSDEDSDRLASITTTTIVKGPLRKRLSTVTEENNPFLVH